MELRDIAIRQHAWLERVGWNNTNPLESLALICSEVGEAANECRGDHPTENFGEELADIILRTVGLAQREGVDIQAAVLAKMEKNEARGTRGRLK